LSCPNSDRPAALTSASKRRASPEALLDLCRIQRALRARKPKGGSGVCVPQKRLAVA